MKKLILLAALAFTACKKDSKCVTCDLAYFYGDPKNRIIMRGQEKYCGADLTGYKISQEKQNRYLTNCK